MPILFDGIDLDSSFRIHNHSLYHMKKLLLLFSFLTLIFAGSHPALAVEKSYTIEFTPTVAENNSLNATTIKNSITTGKDYVASITSDSRIFSGTTNGLRLGSGSGTGSFTIVLTNTTQVTKIVISAKTYNDDQSKIKYNGGSLEEHGYLTSEFVDYTWNICTEITKIPISIYGGRAYVKSVTVYYEGTEGGGQNPLR